MALTHPPDTDAAAWLIDSQTPPNQFVKFGPLGYEAYARLRYLPDPTSSGQFETDADISGHPPLWASQARRALSVLADFTDPPGRCFLCIWEGIAGNALSAVELRGPLVTILHRRYVLFTGRLSDYTEAFESPFDNDRSLVPALVWPADRRWFFASDVDAHWAGIGAERKAIGKLLGTCGLDVVRATPDEQPPTYL